MNSSNPTPLRVGMTGTLGGYRYRVAGRVLMAMEEEGETYRWNEFHLLDDRGQSATLVHEETEGGGQWRLFFLFVPDRPLGAAEAASKRVGDSVDINGAPFRVTLVDESRVEQVEGQAPEGVEVGDVARYFNAEAGGQMNVVSWTGDEVEYYRGMDLAAAAVAAAFRLPAFAATSSPQPTTASGAAPARRVLGCALVFLAVVVIAALWLSGRADRTRRPVKPKLPPAPLALGSAGAINGVTWRVMGHAIVEIALVSALFDRHEYHLQDEQGHGALLVFGLTPVTRRAFLFTPFLPMSPITPQQAAALRGGKTVDLGGGPARISDLCRVLVGKTEGARVADPAPGAEYYGFTAREGTNLLLVRWNGQGILFSRGQPLPEGAIAGFGAKPPN